MAKKTKGRNRKQRTQSGLHEHTYEEVVHRAVEQNFAQMKEYRGFADMHVALSSNPRTPELICVVIYTRLPDTEDYPQQLKVTLPSGKTCKVNVEVVTSFGTARAHASDGDAVCAQNSAFFTGTLCGKVKDVPTGQKLFYLTCSHVLSGGDAVNKGGDIDPNQQEQVLNASDGFTPIGKWCYGLLNDHLDIALIDTEGFEPPEPNSYPSEVMAFNSSLIGKTVFINGAKNKEKAFIVGQSNAPVSFDYNNQIHSLGNLIKLSRFQYYQESVTLPGDSGSVAYLTETSQPLGMVVGANEQYTFLIPFTDIFSVLPVTF